LIFFSSLFFCFLFPFADGYRSESRSPRSTLFFKHALRGNLVVAI